MKHFEPFCIILNMVQQILGRTNLAQKKIKVKFFVPKIVSTNDILAQKVRKNWVPKNVGQNFFWFTIKTMLVQNNLRLQRIGSQKICRNQVSNILDYANLDKCYPDICCLKKCPHDSCHQLCRRSQEPTFLCLVKVWSLTIGQMSPGPGQILPGQMAMWQLESRCSQEPKFKVSSKSGQ